MSVHHTVQYVAATDPPPCHTCVALQQNITTGKSPFNGCRDEQDLEKVTKQQLLNRWCYTEWQMVIDYLWYKYHRMTLAPIPPYSWICTLQKRKKGRNIYISGISTLLIPGPQTLSYSGISDVKTRLHMGIRFMFQYLTTGLASC